MCDFKNHPFKEIFSADAGWNEEQVIYWCEDCGTVLITQESDNRIFNRKGYISKLAQEKFNEMQSKS